jgi:hypothetical protein
MTFTLKDIKRKNLFKEDLFGLYDEVNSIQDLKKVLNVKTADEAYTIAIDKMNGYIKAVEKHQKELEEKKKLKKKANII